VLLVPEELAVQRVQHRVNAGGHDVPEDKIRQRYQRLWPLVATAITPCDSATVYDNSALKGPRIVAQMSRGHPIGAPTWPVWTPQVLSSRWPA
jgi:predicted ABC-type ATPase